MEEQSIGDCMNNVVRSIMLVKELDSRKMDKSLGEKYGG